MKKGYSLIELVVVMALTAILLSTASLSVKKVKERRALEKAKSEVAATMRSYVTRSYNDGEKYTVAIDLVNGYINVTTSGEGVVSRELPQTLNYSVSSDGVTLNEITTTGENEDSDDANWMKVYINDSDNNNKYMVEMLKSDMSKLIDVKVKRRIDGGWEEE